MHRHSCGEFKEDIFKNTMCAKWLHWWPILCNHVAHQAPLPIEFSRQEYWSGLPCLFLGNLPNHRIKPTPLMSPALAGRWVLYH